MPFKSPTYSPIAYMKNMEIIVRKARLSEESGEKPGLVISDNEAGIVVTAGDGLSILITCIEFSDKELLRGANIASTLSIVPGDQFQSV